MDKIFSTDLLRYAPDIVFISDAHGQIVFANDKASEVLGYSVAELLKLTVLEISPPDWRERYRLGFKLALGDTQRHTFEIRLITKTGQKIPMELLLVSMPNGQLFGSCRDISERKAAELKINAANKQLTDLIDALPDAIFFKDAKGRFLLTNEPAKRLFNLHQIDWQGKTDAELAIINPALASAHAVCIADDEAAWQGRRLLLSHEEVTDQSGELRSFEVFKLPQFDAQGERAGLIVVGRDITERKIAEKNIHTLAYYEPLTKLPNRRFLLDRLAQTLVASEQQQRYGALLFIDLDHFKAFKATLGDAILSQVAHRLQNYLQANYSLACLGGDAFVIVIEPFSTELKIAAEEAETLVRKISACIRQPYQVNGQELRTSASIGIAFFNGAHESPQELLKQAKSALDAAKKAGRNTYKFYNPELQAMLAARNALEHELRLAIEKRQLTLHYQIQVNSQARPVGVEVLARWHHPQHGMIPPTEFIPLSEETGLIVPLGLWVLEQACQQLRAWQDSRVMQDMVLAVNLSARQLHETDFVTQIRRILIETGANPAKLKLELTESSVLENIEESINKMLELQLLGIRFAIDDFGTGHSSLQYLKRLPLDQIKIDQSFVRDIATDPNDAVIVKTIISMSEAMGLNVIAEGVETPVQREFLIANGCHVFQGHLFGAAVTLAEFESLVQQLSVQTDRSSCTCLKFVNSGEPISSSPDQGRLGGVLS